MILYKKVLGKKYSNKWKCMIHNSRFFFSSDLFSSGLFFLVSYFLRLYWQPPDYFRKKVLGIQNTGLYFHWQFFQGLDKIRTFFQSFYFQLFFPETFFPGLSYIDSTYCAIKKTVKICICAFVYYYIRKLSFQCGFLNHFFAPFLSF